ncbi:MAG: DUF4145 domain-containing protein [Candidatus Sulfotelmatobacter sp.]
MSGTEQIDGTNGKPETRRIWCNKCGGARIHEWKFTHHGHEGDPSEDQYFEEWTDSLWACCGCESAVLVHRWEMVGAEGEPGAPQPEVFVYPPRTYGKKQPKYFIKLPRPLSKLYNEVVEAFNSGSMLLCTIGLRALIEGVCIDKGITQGKLEQKIDGLSKFFPNKTLIDSLHGFRFTGNDAAHDLEAMYPTEASDVVDVMEDLLNFLYEFDYKASQIKNASRQAKIREEKAKAKSGSVQ